MNWLNDEFTLQLHNPPTEEERDALLDVDMEHTNSVTFHTKHGKEVEFIKLRRGWWIPIDSYSAFGGSEEVWRAHGNPTAFHYCSECKEQSRLDEFGNEILSKYCPDCGAIMNGVEE